MPSVKHVHTHNRADFLQLMACIGYAFDPQRFSHHKLPAVLAISGAASTGKSLAAEGIIKSWIDRFSHEEATTIAPDNKMFLESYPCAAALDTAATTDTVGGKSLKIAFNSCFLYDLQDLKTRLASDQHAFSTIDALVVSNLYRVSYMHHPRPPIWMEIDMHAQPSKTDLFNRAITLTVYKDKLLASPQFKIYWNRIDDLFAPSLTSAIADSAPANRRLQPA